MKFPRSLAVLIIMGIASTFAANHIAARVAFDHGVNVITAVAVRSGLTALIVLGLLVAWRVPRQLPRTTLWRLGLVGVLILLQSFCLYSAVARIPVALALLTFNTTPLVYTLLTWALTGQRPRASTAVAMAVAVAGLALALGLFTATDAVSAALTSGIAFAFGASLSFALVLALTDRWLLKVDGRLRSCLSMAVVCLGALTIALSGITGTGLALPRDPTGWLALGGLTLLYGTAITFTFILFARLDMPNNSIALNFEPVAALGLGWLLLDQTLGGTQLLGMLVVLGAILYIGTRKGTAA